MDSKEAEDAMIKSYAKEHSVTLEEAARIFWANFKRKSEQTIQTSDPYTLNAVRPAGEPGEMSLIEVERSKTERFRMELEQKRLDIEQKKIDAEIRKAELAEKKIEADAKTAREKIEAEVKTAKEKLEADERWREKEAARKEKEDERKADEHREEMRLQREQQREDAIYNKLMLQLSTGDKKPNEVMELLKSQNEKDKELIKANADKDKEYYKTLSDSREKDRDREMQWKTAIAELESNKEIELAKLRAEDPRAASASEVLIAELREGFQGLATQLQGKSGGDILEHVKKYNEFNKTIVEAAMPILRSQGFDENQLAKVRTQVGLEEKKQEGVLEKVGGFIWKQIEGKIQEATTEVKKVEGAPSGLEPLNQQAAQQAEERRLQEAKIKAEEAERMKKEQEAQALKLTNEYNTKNAELDALKKGLEERKGLIELAMQIGIVVDPALTNEQLMANIQKRDNLLSKALEIGITPDLSMTDEQIFDVIERHEAAIEQQITKQEQAAAAIESPKPEKSGPAPVVAEHIVQVQKSIKGPQGTEGIIQDAQLVAEEVTEIPKPDVIEQKKKKSKKEKATRRAVKKFTVTLEDGTSLGEFEAATAHGAAIKSNPGGTKENPVKVKVQGEGSETTEYTAYRDEKNHMIVKKPEVQP